MRHDHAVLPALRFVGHQSAIVAEFMKPEVLSWCAMMNTWVGPALTSEQSDTPSMYRILRGGSSSDLQTSQGVI